jgi:hypothetical protein
MALCGFKPDMVRGNSIYLKGVLEATLERDANPKQAILIEIGELHLFMNAFKDVYEQPEYAEKRRAQMIYGIAIITLAFFEEVVAMSDSKNISIEEAGKTIIEADGKFLEDIEDLHQSLKKNNQPKETMEKVVVWVNENDHSDLLKKLVAS